MAKHAGQFVGRVFAKLLNPNRHERSRDGPAVHFPSFHQELPDYIS
jgi:hypothetical protein